MIKFANGQNLKKHKMNKLIFDKENHIYTLNGTKLFSVTQSLVQSGLIDTRWFTDEGRDRGKAVHEAIYLDLHNDLYVDGLHEIIRPYLDAWFKFKTEMRFKPILELCELKQFHPIYMYAGTPDSVGLLNGRHVLIDWKTGDASTAHLQTAAYKEFPRIKPYNPDRLSLRLYKTGKYKLIKHDDQDDFYNFLSNLKIARGKLNG